MLWCLNSVEDLKMIDFNLCFYLVISSWNHMFLCCSARMHYIEVNLKWESLLQKNLLLSTECELALNMTQRLWHHKTRVVERHLHHDDITETLSIKVRGSNNCMFSCSEREKALSRCLAFVIMFEEDGLVFSDVHHLPPPIPACCCNRKCVWAHVRSCVCLWLSHNTLWSCVCLWEGKECSSVCVPEPGYMPFICTIASLPYFS